MRILISQPNHENHPQSLENAIRNNLDCNIFLFPEGYLNDLVAMEYAQKLALEFKVSIITSARENNIDKAIVINQYGELIYNRLKTKNENCVVLNSPLYFKNPHNAQNTGFLLCMEILKGRRDLPETDYSFIAHPIGVGMFSEEQFELWLAEAKKIAKKFKTIVIGTSHADGSYKNCGISIPIAYCIDSFGNIIFVAHNDTKNRKVEIINSKPKEIF